MTLTREPVQTRSINTKNKIILAGYELFAKNGYYKTNTAQIAKEAQVSTGIVYGYFNNKKDILVEVVKKYIELVYDPIFELLDSFKTQANLKELIIKVIDLAKKLHDENHEMHKQLNAISLIDEDINTKFVELQDVTTEKFVKKLKDVGYKKITNENIHLAMNIIESYVHEYVFDKHEYLDYGLLKKKVVEVIEFLFIWDLK